MITFNDTAKQLLISTVPNLSNKLESDKALLHVRSLAFDHLLRTGESVQVHVTITRDRDDFLGSFEVEEMT